MPIVGKLLHTIDELEGTRQADQARFVEQG